VALINLLTDVIANIKPADVEVHYKRLLKFFLQLFDYRSSAPQFSNVLFHSLPHSHSLTHSFPHTTMQKDNKVLKDVETVEDATIKAFQELVMKLNELMFKPLFLKVLDWSGSTVGGLAKMSKDDDSEEDEDATPASSLNLHRRSFFYRLVISLADRLKVKLPFLNIIFLFFNSYQICFRRFLWDTSITFWMMPSTF